ncbi:MAG: GNAT family N-acetyltransferase [Deltaproteobacteria bacterium]|nr:GNAT family N-acetyltransferase [Deltaproteobacteria bacterium]
MVHDPRPHRLPPDPLSAAGAAAPAVTLRPLRPEDAERIRRWMADIEMLRNTVLVPGPCFAPVRAYTEAEADRYLTQLMTDVDRFSFAIELDGAHVGNVGLKAIDRANAMAECFIEIGEKEARGRGVGHRAMELLLEHAFSTVGLRLVFLGVFEFNQAALRLYRGLGFDDGPQYGWHYVDGEYFEVVGMLLTRDAHLSRTGRCRRPVH